MMFRYLMNMINRASRRKLHVLLLVVSILLLIFFRRHVNMSTGSRISFYISIFGEKILPEPTQADLDYFSKYVKIRYTVDDNFISGALMGTRSFYTVLVVLYNSGDQVIPAKRWQLHGYFIRLVEPSAYPYPGGFYIRGCGMRIKHVGGSLYMFEPVGNFYDEIKPGGYMRIRMKVAGFQVSKTDTMPNWYVAANNLASKTIANTAGESLEFATDYVRESQYKRRQDDPFQPYSSSDRYKIFEEYRGRGKQSDSVSTAWRGVVPTPLESTLDINHTIEWNTNTWVIVSNSAFAEEIKYLSETMSMKVVTTPPKRKGIMFLKGTPVSQSNVKMTNEEAYSLASDASEQKIVITASTNRGAFYAIQTLISLVFTPEATSSVGALVYVPSFHVVDAPRYPYRGLHIDVARNFHSKEQIKHVMDVMSMYKMNKLHLHLSDDEGWRLEIPGIPELTQIGSKRCHDLEEEQCIMPMLGSGPYSNTSGSGYYSVGDYKDILQFAKSRHIDVIPEIDMPGHSRAAIRSIHAKSQQSHRRAMKTNSYSVIEDGDKSVYRSGQHFTDDVINPCLPSTYKFVEKIMTELQEMHKGIQPLTFYHFGGDEVARGAWAGSKACKRLQEKMPGLVSEYDLMNYFVHNLTQTAMSQGMSVGAWEDGLIKHEKTYFEGDLGTPFPRNTLPNKDIYVYVWKRPTETRTPHRTRLFANYGYKVILSYGSYLYFDHPYEPDPEERGLYWATRKISTHDVWGLTPDIIDHDLSQKCPSVVKDQTDCFTMKKPENIMGIQAQLWSETVRTGEQMDYMLFPRLLAVAERSWHEQAWRPNDSAGKTHDWLNFVAVVGGKELRRLDKLGVKYRVSPPGAIVKDGKLAFNTEFPGLDVEYYSSADNMWKLASHNMPVTSRLLIRTRSSDGSHHSRIISVDAS